MKISIAGVILALAPQFVFADAMRVEHVVPRVLVEVRWVENNRELYERASEVGACQGPGACKAFSQLAKMGETWICLITMVKPASWENNAALAALGHETLHCMGYQHEP